MVLTTFVLIQIGICALGTGIVYFLHARRLRAEGIAAFAAWEQATAALSLNEGDDAHKVWLAERVTAISGDDPVNIVRRLVLEHEPRDGKTLGRFLQPLLLPEDLPGEWARLRSEHHGRIIDLMAAVPSSPSGARFAIMDFNHYSSVDTQLGFTPEKFPDLPEGSGGHSRSLAEENAALQAELATVLAGTDDDLRKMLKQFTQDAREMMSCIQQLEKENQALKASLTQSQAA